MFNLAEDPQVYGFISIVLYLVVCKSASDGLAVSSRVSFASMDDA